MDAEFKAFKSHFEEKLLSNNNHLEEDHIGKGPIFVTHKDHSLKN